MSPSEHSRKQVKVIERDPDNNYFVRVSPSPALGRNEVGLRILSAGLCGTDIQIINGLRAEPASILGHEAVCVVEEVGPKWANRFPRGQLVAINPTSKRDPNFLLGHTINGVFRSHIVIPNYVVELGQLVTLPQTLDPSLGVLVEPLACALYSWTVISRYQPQRVVVFGDGTIGVLVAIVARRELDAKNVKVIGRNTNGPMQNAHVLAKKRFLSSAFVIATPRDSTEERARQAIAMAGDGSVIDVIGGLEAGSDPLLKKISRTRAANVCGTPNEPIVFTRQVSNSSDAAKITITGHRGVSNEHLRAASRMIAESPGDFQHLLSHRVDCHDAVKIFNALAANNERSCDGRRIRKMAIDFDGTGT